MLNIARYQLKLTGDPENPAKLRQTYSLFPDSEPRYIGDGVFHVAFSGFDGRSLGQYVITADPAGDSAVIGYGPLRCTDFSGP